MLMSVVLRKLESGEEVAVPLSFVESGLSLVVVGCVVAFPCRGFSPPVVFDAVTDTVFGATSLSLEPCILVESSVFGGYLM